MTATACLFDSSVEGCQIVRFCTAVKETAKLGESKVKYPATTVSKWNAQRPACVFHFIREAKKSEDMSLEVTSIVLGIMFTLGSLLCQYGAERHEEKA